VIVTANEVQLEQLARAPEALRTLPWTGLHLVGLRQATGPDEFVASLDQSLEGVTQAMRPDWWVPYDKARADVVNRAKPLAELMQKRPVQKAELEQAVSESKLTASELRYLPLTSSKHQDWIAI